MTRRLTALDIITLVITLIATFAPAVQPQLWFGSTDHAWTPTATSISAGLFNDDAMLDTTQVVLANGSNDGGLDRLGKHADRPDWDAAMAKCRATGEWSEVECHEAVGNGEF